ncbi:DUF1330 domain-containing protein [Microvirga thermotolerans]|uniref:DUF1330 domain-containing protein n=1 Tax=Microvirga thermotolerans TaxID=2651334 RepID=A0A5P9K312_9HYPH|nr:DUF1330 domain-containing protein [Microvirga thermotolerans]QFU18065.1 DUF1330 domain-containing protein [Microvirga thermotolerans]
MPAYAIGHLRNVLMGPEIVEYLERIDATLAPFGGRFLIHGGIPETVEGTWDGALVVIAFPDMERVRAWYASPEYQAILRLRTDRSESTVVFYEGVPGDHRATDVLTC